ncbi:allatostatins-like [Eriocheir sinensis]|uniref:allatostatins-like n=1 Tax=Eriocheir sinensis TaxID=95602 RepID=UPI0021C648FA|nr:allatostatins-like [Eriocheir sinensis]
MASAGVKGAGQGQPSQDEEGAPPPLWLGVVGLLMVGAATLPPPAAAQLEPHDSRALSQLNKVLQQYEMAAKASAAAAEEMLETILAEQEEAQEEEELGFGKRRTSPLANSYSFGLGKRSGRYYFGLGKKSDPYSFGLGKKSGNYNFGLGKRSVRDVTHQEEEEEEEEETEAGKRSKREVSEDGNTEEDKRTGVRGYSFGQQEEAR